jgi:hypothetical protein
LTIEYIGVNLSFALAVKPWAVRMQGTRFYGAVLDRPSVVPGALKAFRPNRSSTARPVLAAEGPLEDCPIRSWDAGDELDLEIAQFAHAASL